MAKFPNTLSHRSQPSHNPKPRQPITYISLGVKRELQSSPSVQENIAFLQNGCGLNVAWVPGQTTVRHCVCSTRCHLCVTPPAKDLLDHQPPPQDQAPVLRQSTAQTTIWSSLLFLSTMLGQVLGALKDRQGQGPLFLGPFGHPACHSSYIELYFSIGLSSVMSIIQFRCENNDLCPFFFSWTRLEVGLHFR